MGQILSFKEVGAPNTPQEVKRFRRQNMDLCRWQGQSVILKHMWNQDDVTAGIAKKCPACYDDAYDQVRNDCGVCYSVGFVSVENDPTHRFINTLGVIVSINPGTNVEAPRYGGFGPSFLTWVLEPDVAVDVFRINEQGVMIQTYDATSFAPWYPKLGDNDLLINVDLGPDGYTILSTHKRFQLKMVQQVTLRGWGKRGQGQQHLIGQTFQMSAIPSSNIFDLVPYNDPDPLVYRDAGMGRGIAVVSGVEVYP